MTTQCKHADSGCNYPEGECLNMAVCMMFNPGTSERLIELVLRAVSERSDREWTLMHLSLSEAAEVAKKLQAYKKNKVTTVEGTQ